ncbi:response regulator transcription factor [Clostridium sp. NSJ-6]|uniref:Stage 0 sporulation protein A homolog n=1 Tax=Clostridium hominis TaxID=2763036 RepID=A0ABR7D8P9_9CLOT|nr:response regulator transcription factor [Clostridium hominis]MBC5627756.1 response regulator transcription factor [Clostridium hominis]
MNNNINILVVDDEETIVDVIEAYLKNAGYNVFTAYDGKEAISIFNNENINLIILDLMLPDISGEEVCKIIKNEKDVPIIMLTAKINEDDILNGFNLGADDYVVKPFSVKQLIARVSAVLRRVKDLSSSPILSFNNGDLIINLESHEVKKNNKLITLTRSEYNILLTLSENIKRVFTRNELIDRVMGEDVDVFDRIIDSHIKNLRSKIEDDSKSPKYILTIYGVGYKFGGNKDD